MIQFHLSKALSSDLAMHLQECENICKGVMHWYGHRVFVQRRKCIIMMELQSRYCMTFCGLTKPDFKRFPKLFEDRLWREVLAICQPDESQAEKLTGFTKQVAAEQNYRPGHDRSVQSHINEVAWCLDDVSWEAGRLPADSVEEFAFGVHMNETPRRYKGRKGCFIPIEVFREIWTGKLENTLH
jgi:hypothetical protein